ncbi:MAG: DUF3500 domain-containing protein [Chitinophagaceae bacterium]|nr:DUF3500 domain-containing protein [Chitinophagaceae bacterium]
MPAKKLPFAVCAFLLSAALSAQQPGTAAAAAYVNALNETQQSKSVFPFDEMNRYDWSYLPASMVPRTGIAVKDLDSNQKKLCYALLKQFLSAEGNQKAWNIMNMEYVLIGLQPTNPNRIPENYFVTVYGHPHPDSAWGWKFTGHHMSLNFTVVKDQLAVAPFFFGIYPAQVPEGPKKGLRTIQAEEDLGFALVNSLNESQKAKALFQLKAFSDIVTTNSAEVAPLKNVGIPAGELTSEQKNKLNQLINTYLSAMPPLTAKARMKKIQAENPDAIRFGWAGALVSGQPHYYRIQGQNFLIEFDNTQNNANHIHTVWRDFYDDFGLDLLREHYHSATDHH